MSGWCWRLEIAAWGRTLNICYKNTQDNLSNWIMTHAHIALDHTIRLILQLNIMKIQKNTDSLCHRVHVYIPRQKMISLEAISIRTLTVPHPTEKCAIYTGAG